MYRNKFRGYVRPMLLTLFFAAIFLAYLSPIGTGDAWWHLNNGRWIVENGQLPSVDHFTHTASPEHSEKKTFVLQSYWLSQSLMYLIYKAAGFRGMVAAKALVFVFAFLMLYLCLRAGKLGVYASAASVAPIALTVRIFGEDRPQILSFMMCITVFYLLERTRETEGGGRRLLPLLPLSIALWSNLHGGDIIGMGMVGIYLIMESLEFLWQREGWDPRASMTRALWLLGSVLAAGLNPDGYGSLWVTWLEMGQDPFARMIDEYMSTFAYARMAGDHYLLVGMAAIGAVTALVLLLSWRRLRLEHLVLYVLFGSAGYAYFRFSVFFALMGPALAACYVDGLLIRGRSLREVPGWLKQGSAIAAFSWVIWAGVSSGHILREPVDSTYAPTGAVSTIRAMSLPREIFNPYEWGGYLGWWLYPQYRVFVDSRAIDLKAQLDYEKAKEGDLRILDARGVNTVVFYTLKPIWFGSGVPGVVLSLLNDQDWGLLYFDGMSAIFVRTKALGRRTAMLGKDLLWGQLESRLEYLSADNPSDYRPLVDLAELYAARGMRYEAIESLSRSLLLRPGNAEAMRVANKLGIILRE